MAFGTVLATRTSSNGGRCGLSRVLMIVGPNGVTFATGGIDRRCTAFKLHLKKVIEIAMLLEEKTGIRLAFRMIDPLPEC